MCVLGAKKRKTVQENAASDKKQQNYLRSKKIAVSLQSKIF